MAWEPQTGALWTAVNERDELGSDLVPDYMTAVRDGAFYGWPYSYFGRHIDDRVQPAGLIGVAGTDNARPHRQKRELVGGEELDQEQPARDHGDDDRSGASGEQHAHQHRIYEPQQEQGEHHPGLKAAVTAECVWSRHNTLILADRITGDSTIRRKSLKPWRLPADSIEGMRATRAYMAGFGTAGSLLAGAAILFVLASTFVAFHGWPNIGGQGSSVSLNVSAPRSPAGSATQSRLAASSLAAGRVATAFSSGASAVTSHGGSGAATVGPGGTQGVPSTGQQPQSPGGLSPVQSQPTQPTPCGSCGAEFAAWRSSITWCPAKSSSTEITPTAPASPGRSWKPSHFTQDGPAAMTCA